MLWNNVGIIILLARSKTKQSHELQYSVNNLSYFLLTYLLRLALEIATKSTPKDTIYVVQVSSSATNTTLNPAIDLENMDYYREESAQIKYSRSKVASVIHLIEFAQKLEGTGILSLVSFKRLVVDKNYRKLIIWNQALNPGNFVTNL